MIDLGLYVAFNRPVVL